MTATIRVLRIPAVDGEEAEYPLDLRPGERVLSAEWDRYSRPVDPARGFREGVMELVADLVVVVTREEDDG